MQIISDDDYKMLQNIKNPPPPPPQPTKRQVFDRTLNKWVTKTLGPPRTEKEKNEHIKLAFVCGIIFFLLVAHGII